MGIKIVIDSACDKEQALSESVKIDIAPLILDIDDKTYIDDENIDMSVYLNDLRKMTGFKTACPSIQTFENLYRGEDDILVMTISSNLSASYQSAVSAKNQYFENCGNNKKIHVFDSLSASAGQVSILVKMIECVENGMEFDEIVDIIEAYIKKNKTVFMLHDLNVLAKAGRVSNIIAATTAVLNIRCVMGASGDGKIELLQKVIGEKRGIKHLATMIASFAGEFKEKTLCISHCEAIENVEVLLSEISKIIDIEYFKKVLIQKTGGLASLYAGIGGIVIGV